MFAVRRNARMGSDLIDSNDDSPGAAKRWRQQTPQYPDTTFLRGADGSSTNEPQNR